MVTDKTPKKAYQHDQRKVVSPYHSPSMTTDPIQELITTIRSAHTFLSATEPEDGNEDQYWLTDYMFQRILKQVDEIEEMGFVDAPILNRKHPKFAAGMRSYREALDSAAA